MMVRPRSWDPEADAEAARARFNKEEERLWENRERKWQHDNQAENAIVVKYVRALSLIRLSDSAAERLYMDLPHGRDDHGENEWSMARCSYV